MEGVYGVGTWRIATPDQANATEKAWAESYRKRFKAEPDDVAATFYDYTSWVLQEVRNAGRDLTTEKLVKALQASTFKGVNSYDTQRFANNHIDPEWTRVEQVVQGRWTARSSVVDPAKISL